MKLTEKIAYMRGLFDGMELDAATKEGKAILQMAEVMGDMANYIEKLENQVDELTELCDLLDQDLGEVESDLYADEDDDYDYDDDEDYDFDDDDDDDYPLGAVITDEDDEDEDDDFTEIQYVVTCPSCNETVNLSEYDLEEGSINCPHCGELLEFNYDNIATEFAEDIEAEGDDPDGEA